MPALCHLRNSFNGWEGRWLHSTTRNADNVPTMSTDHIFRKIFRTHLPGEVIMRRNTLRSLTSLCVAALVMTVVGCGPQSPEAKIAQIRDGYTIELNTWHTQEPPTEPLAIEEAVAEAAEAAAVAMSAEAAATAGEAATAEESAEGEEMEENMESGPQPKNVLFDLVVYFRGRKALEGITVDVTHSDDAQQEKAVYQQYIETAGMVNGDTRQVDFLLEDLMVEDGDAFAVTLASGVPADLGNYREFSEPAP